MEIDTILVFLSTLFASYSNLLPAVAVSVLAVIGSLHLVMPIAQSLAEAIVKITPSKKDDELYEKVTRSKVYLAVIKFVAWVSGLKLPETKKVSKKDI